MAAIEGVAGVVFFGGTALTRTVLPDLRLSEDIDLIAVRPRSAVVRDLASAIEQGLARSFGEVRWRPPLDATRDAQPTALAVQDRLSVQVQVVSQTGRAVLPTQRRTITQRFSDAPPVILETLTDSGFAAA
ncbi:MAG: nucleotidyl transferase AbiEii/AbiGii toxin family protein, partial [Microbacteriaceae bacterium]|nr:nucleotidyl transferase AbiEii/AbiGii toxin family protein [Microbacteriaceae bacterium]